LSVVIDRIEVKKEKLSRIAESVESAVNLGKGRVEVYFQNTKKIYSLYSECLEHKYVAPTDMHPRLFSFNHYSGACPTCTGLGIIRKFDIRKIITDWNKSISQGAIGPYSAQRMTNPRSWRRAMLESVGRHFGFTLDTPMKDFTPQQLDVLFNGSKGEEVEIVIKQERATSVSEYTRKGEWEGLFKRWESWMESESESLWSHRQKEKMLQYYSEYSCPDCGRKRLKPEILAIKVGNKSIYDLSTLAVDEFLRFLNTLKLDKRRKQIAERIILELKKRAQYLVDVGLSYLTLDRRSSNVQVLSQMEKLKE
ncbi:MAG: hypothetical protein ACTSRO_09775, partial [Candidatus Heimdallarchaeaceae archaeon]